MADSYIQAPPDSTGKLIDTDVVTVGPNTVQRQRVRLAGTDPAAIADITATPTAGGEHALVVRQSADQDTFIALRNPASPLPVSFNQQGVCIDDATTSGQARVTDSTPTPAMPGLVTRPILTTPVDVTDATLHADLTAILSALNAIATRIDNLTIASTPIAGVPAVKVYTET